VGGDRPGHRGPVTALALAALALVASGCVEHRLVVQPPADAKEVAVIESRRASDPLPADGVRLRDGLPLEFRASAWRRDETGGLWREELAIATDRPWWQRFPADMVSDALIPKAFIVEQRATIQLEAVEPVPADHLRELAISHGYGGRAAEER